MHSRFTFRSLETWTRSSVRLSDLQASVHSRSFGSTGSTSFVAVSHKLLDVRNETTMPISESSKHGSRTYAQREHADRTKPTSHRLKLGSRGLLHEVHIATTVKELCGAGKLEEAIEYCENVPTALQGPVAWNTVIKGALDAKMYNSAYKLYQQMKKRAIKPTIITFRTFLSAYAQASPETLTPLQLERAQKFYKDWVDITLTARTKSTVNANTAAHPAAAYINVLANAKQYQSIWDTFYELSSEGPLAPDEFVFTSMFVAFAKRGTNTTPVTPDGTDAVLGDVPSTKARNAQDAKMLWRMTLRALERQPFPVDSHLLTAVLRCLQQGGQAELELGLHIISDYVGLRAPDAAAPATNLTNPNLELNPRLLGVTLVICGLAKRPDLTQHFIETLTAPKNPQRSSVTTGAMNHLLAAHASLGDVRGIQKTIDWMLREGAIPGGLNVMPGSSSWSLALRTCLNAGDWSAAKALTKRLADTVNNKRTIDAETIYLVLKSAYVLKPDDERLHERQLRQALDAVYFVTSMWPRDPNAAQNEYARVNPGRAERRLVFQNALGDLVKRILNEFDGLSSMGVFHDLAFRLDRLRSDLTKEVVVRYEQDI